MSARLRILSYNVRAMHDDVAALGRVMREVAADVAIIQEAPRFLRWRSKCAALSRRAGMVTVCGGRASGANLILSSLAVDVLETTEVLFSPYRNFHRRGTAAARLRLRGATFVVAGTHLDLAEDARLVHLEELASVTDALADPATAGVIVGGDLNAVPGSATWQRLLAFGPDAFATAGHGDGDTYSAQHPVRRIDGLFSSGSLRCVSSHVVDNADTKTATDHRPLVAEYELRR